MKYDDAGWHYGGEFPENTPKENGGTHIALFIKYCFIKGWAGELQLEYAPEEVQKVVEGKLSATEFLFNQCDEKFTNEDLNEEGNAFAELYYGEDGLYNDDYATHFGEKVYELSENEIDFDKYYEMVEERYKSGIFTKSQRKKDSWKFWKKRKK